jgi:hypothetical protein
VCESSLFTLVCLVFVLSFLDRVHLCNEEAGNVFIRVVLP